ncbi:MAG: hypothetical protein ABJD07_13060 [Gemmatimonadaceae bacterium]
MNLQQRHETLRGATLAAMLLAFAAVARAQDSTASRAPTVLPDTAAGTCAGEIVSEIEYQTGRPPFGGVSAMWRKAARAVGLHHQTTRTSVVAAFVQLEVGQPCTDRLRTETERVLRAQPFIATARVRAVPDSAAAGRVRVIVQTSDEIPIIAGARFSRRTLSRLTLGNSDVAGLGLAAQFQVERGFHYRNGFGARFDDYAFLYKPIRASIAAERDPLGGSWQLGVAHPFFTDLQSTSWRGDVSGVHSYFPILRPANDGLALQIKRSNWEISGLSRLRFLGRLAVGGLVLSGTRVTPGYSGVVVTDTGLVADTGQTLTARYSGFHAVRLGGIVGLRSLTFKPVRGFDALKGTQDVAVGLQAGVLLARGIGAFGESDYHIATEAYAGIGNQHSFVAFQVDAEVRRSLDLGRWEDLISSGRAAWYTPRGRYTLVVSDEFATGWRTRLPMQLTLGGSGTGTDGGARGYAGSLIAGAARNVLRIEQRRFVGTMFKHLDLGIAGFGDVGTVWSGSAPYGRTTTVPRPSLGVSLLGGYPSGSKRLYRVDVAVPLGAGKRRSVDVRFVTDMHALVFWQEPGEVTRSRTGVAPTRIFNWPSR